MEGKTDGPLATQIRAFELFLGSTGGGWPHSLGRRAQSAGAQQPAGDEARRPRVFLSLERGKRDRRGRRSGENVLPRSRRQEWEARNGGHQALITGSGAGRIERDESQFGAVRSFTAEAIATFCLSG